MLFVENHIVISIVKMIYLVEQKDPYEISIRTKSYTLRHRI